MFLLEQESLDEVALHFRAALRIKPDYAEAALNLAWVLARSPESVGKAIALLQRLLGHPVQGTAARETLIGVAEGADIGNLPRDFSKLVGAWLGTGAVSPREIERLSWRLVLARPQIPDDPADDNFLMLVLSRCLAISSAAERLVLALRRKAFALAEAAQPPSPNLVNWLAPLALQAFNAGYVYPTETAENVFAARLRVELEAALDAGDLSNATSLALFGLVAPLGSLRHAKKFLDAPSDHWPTALRPLIEQTLIEPREECRVRAEIPSLGALSDKTSNQVRSHFETHPYPR